MNAHFIDINILIEMDSKPWIVSKDNPNEPIMKMEEYQFNLFKSGIFQKQNNKLKFNGETFWLSNEFMNRLKIVCKKNKKDISNLAVSMQEYLNPEITKDAKFKINMDIFKSINNNEDIYIICSKNNRENYKHQIEKLNENLKSTGLHIKNFYFISETFYNRNDDEISYNKIKLLLQHLLGRKFEGNTITDKEITKYSNIYYYDDNKKSIKLSESINKILEKSLFNSNKEFQSQVKNIINSSDSKLIVKEYTNNKRNRFNETIVSLEYPNIIKTFENFKY
jgi:hypothetical protein